MPFFVNGCYSYVPLNLTPLKGSDMPTKIGRTFSGRRKQLWPFPFALPVTANDLRVPAGMEPRFVGCKSFALSTEWRLHWAVWGCSFELPILPLWDKGNCTDFADNSRSCRSILVKFVGVGWLTCNKLFNFDADPDPGIIWQNSYCCRIEA